VTASVIIVNYRTWEHLERCLAGLVGGAPGPALDLDVVVVDNDPADGRRREFERRFETVRFIGNRGNPGFAHGCNLGAAHARGEWLFFVNPDLVADPQRLARLLAVKQRHPEVAILTGRQVDADGRPQKAFDCFPRPWTSLSMLRWAARKVAPRRFPDPRSHHTDLVHCDWVSGSLLLMAAEDYRRLGGWSEDYWMYMEDVDLCARAHRMGLRAAYTPEVEFVHAHGAASRRDEQTTALTKSETVISKHVYIAGHFEGLRARSFHTLVAVKTLPGLALGALLDRLTLGRVPALCVRSRMLRILAPYYLRSLRGGGWLSPRAPNFVRP
jgi:GT2 family glycosyltransferase